MRTFIFATIIALCSINSAFAEDASIQNIQNYNWNKKIEKANNTANHFNKQMNKALKDINPEVRNNTHVGLRVNGSIQFGFLLKF